MSMIRRHEVLCEIFKIFVVVDFRKLLFNFMSLAKEVMTYSRFTNNFGFAWDDAYPPTQAYVGFAIAVGHSAVPWFLRFTL